LLHNPSWNVWPSVAFVGDDNAYQAPVLLTCRFHRNGSKSEYLHPPRSPNGVLPAVVWPNTIKQLKPHKFSNSYQMQRMEGQYNGVDTLWVSECHSLSEYSYIIGKNESLTIKGRLFSESGVRIDRFCHVG
jgi:hypothetical protein